MNQKTIICLIGRKSAAVRTVGGRSKEIFHPAQPGRRHKMLKEKLKKAGRKLAAVPVAVMAAGQSAVMAYADGLDDLGVEGGSTMMQNVTKTLCQLAQYAGVFLAVVGLIMLFMGFKNEDAEAKHRAGLVIVAAIGLIATGTIVNTVVGDGFGS